MSKVFSEFVAPISATQPAGIDIEYDARFINIQALVEGKPEQQYGDVIIEAEAPDWVAIEKLCTQLLSESKDINVFGYYIQSLTVLYGMPGFSKGCEILLANLEKYWSDLYPKLVDEDGNYDYFYRQAAIELLTSKNGIINQLLHVDTIVPSGNKQPLSIAEVIDILLGNDDASYNGGRDRLIQDLKVAYRSQDVALAHIASANKAVADIEKVFQEKLAEAQIDFSVIQSPLSMIVEVMTENYDEDISSVDDTLDNHEQLNSNLKQTANSNTSKADLDSIIVNDRHDVRILLDKLTLYFRHKEPSHPAPLFIDRLSRLLDMDFYEILKDISPNSLNDLDILIGKQEDKSNVEDDQF